jgi:putative FmdB family regulatory protein
MPIYAYKCGSCGFAKDVLQKMSDAPLTACPQCGQSTFAKQVTAAGFQLKGSGWYVTDFKGGAKGEGAASKAPLEANTSTGTTSDATTSAAASTEVKPAAASPAPAATTTTPDK